MIIYTGQKKYMLSMLVVTAVRATGPMIGPISKKILRDYLSAKFHPN